MRLLLIHSNSFEYTVREKAIENAEITDSSKMKGEFNNALVVFATIEAEDETDPKAISRKASEEILSVAESVKPNLLVVYPYAHLSSSLASPRAAVEVLRQLETVLAASGFKVVRAPLGYYKSFKIECLGHPLAELSRTVRLAKEPRARAPPPVQEEYKVLDLDGKLHEPASYAPRKGEEDLAALIEKEAIKKELIGGEPKFLDYCRKFGIEWESYSDVGHMRYGPEASLMFDLIGDYAWQLANSVQIPVLQVKGTNLFDLSVKAVKEHADLFGSRLYRVDVEQKNFVMRYAACHQQFSIVKDWNLSYRHLPFGTFEVADSYRLEQSGELLLCFRLRKLHMPDLHIYCKDLEDAKNVGVTLHRRIYEEIKNLQRDYVSVYNITREFFESNRKYVQDLVLFESKPAVLRFVPSDLFYWELNIEYHIIDELGRPREIATWQIDTGNAERFGISYTAQDGSMKHPIIIHTAITGTVERYLFTVFDSAARAEKSGKKPTLPMWLAPVHVRFIPVSGQHIPLALEFAKNLNQSRIRADIDDRDDTVERRVRDAELAWVPYIVVVGQRESKGSQLTVRDRELNQQTTLSMEQLKTAISEKLRGYPFRPLNIPLRSTLRPGYRIL